MIVDSIEYRLFATMPQSQTGFDNMQNVEPAENQRDSHRGIKLDMARFIEQLPDGVTISVPNLYDFDVISSILVGGHKPDRALLETSVGNKEIVPCDEMRELSPYQALLTMVLANSEARKDPRIGAKSWDHCLRPSLIKKVSLQYTNLLLSEYSNDRLSVGVSLESSQDPVFRDHRGKKVSSKKVADYVAELDHTFSPPTYQEKCKIIADYLLGHSYMIDPQRIEGKIQCVSGSSSILDPSSGRIEPNNYQGLMKEYIVWAGRILKVDKDFQLPLQN